MSYRTACAPLRMRVVDTAASPLRPPPGSDTVVLSGAQIGAFNAQELSPVYELNDLLTASQVPLPQP